MIPDYVPTVIAGVHPRKLTFWTWDSLSWKRKKPTDIDPKHRFLGILALQAVIFGENAEHDLHTKRPVQGAIFVCG